MAGAGIAGTTAADLLAGTGLRVLVVDDSRTVPAVGPHVLLTRSDRATLAHSGVPTWPSPGLEIQLGPGDRQVVAEPDLHVCDANQLRVARRNVLTCDVMTGRVTSVATSANGRRVTVRTADESDVEVLARHVVVATGVGGSRANGTTVARRYRLTWPGPARLALVRPSSRRLRPSFARLVPGADGTVTVSRTVLADGQDGDSLSESLRALGLDDLEPAGPPWRGRIDTRFTPGHAARDGLLRIGDAAGLVNPFTGDGIAYALDSAVLAARAIADNPDAPATAAAAYERRLTSAFVGCFETARHGAQRYHLAWRVLESTTAEDGPLFTKGRRAILVPGGLRDGIDERLRLSTVESLWLVPFLAATDEIVVSAIRREWPFLARLMISEGSGMGRHLRPAVLFAGSAAAAGTTLTADHAVVAAAVDLATLATFAFLDPNTASRHVGRRSIDWARTTSLLAGDFLLGQASRLVTTGAPDLAWMFADWLAELTDLRAGRLDGRVPATALFAALFEFPARLGGAVTDCSPEITASLREVGRRCGQAFLYAEDALALRGSPTRLEDTAAGMAARGISTVPDLGVPLRDIPATLAAARAAALRGAHEAIDTLPAGGGRAILHRFATATAEPVAP